jgi:hypothetical protein
MKTKLLLSIIFLTIFASYSANAALPVRKGWWKFDDNANKLKSTIGPALELNGTLESTSGPKSGNNAVIVGVGSYLTLIHGLEANGGGEKVNEYSIQIDFSIPEGEIWHTFIQLTGDNTDDGDLFTNTTNHIGVWEAGYSDTVYTIDTWYRMVLSVRNGEFFRIYMNGELWLDGAGRDLDGRYGLLDTLLFFADNDGEDGEIYCSEIGIWDVALTQEDVTQLGDVSTSPVGIPSHQLGAGNSGLGQNYPNPFSYSTTFPYEVNQTGNVDFSIFDLSGREIALIEEGVKTPGKYKLALNSDKLPNGVYYFQMTSNQQTSLRKMIVLH